MESVNNDKIFESCKRGAIDVSVISKGSFLFDDFSYNVHLKNSQLSVFAGFRNLFNIILNGPTMKFYILLFYLFVYC